MPGLLHATPGRLCPCCGRPCRPGLLRRAQARLVCFWCWRRLLYPQERRPVTAAPDYGPPPPPVAPTSALPGTPAKLQVLEQRARYRQPLFHPLDAQDEG
jgi:hypothetical protein